MSTDNFRVLLAPMEGVVDNHMRKILTELGGYDYCVTEFVRVVDHLLPVKVFRRYCPELSDGGRTPSGTPVIVQLLGSKPEIMAINAHRAARLGALGIDLNFGCPAKCVNKNNGGAILLKEPQKLYDIVHAVRSAVDENIPVSAKIRLGYENTDLALDNAFAVQSAGADFITVHARTKIDGYKHPARWEWLARINAALHIPVVANGDINSVSDYRRCIEISGCKQVMIGRNAVARPDLARQIKLYEQGLCVPAIEWGDVQALLAEMAESMKVNVKGRFVVARIKQWLSMLKREYHEAQSCFDAIRTLTQYSELASVLNLKQT